MLMSRFIYILSTVIIFFCSVSLSSAENLKTEKNNKTFDLSYIHYDFSNNNTPDYNLYKYKTRQDLFSYIANPYINDLSKAINKEQLHTYALKYHTSIMEYDNTASPAERYSAGKTSFSIKSMNIFSNNDYDSTVNDTIYSLFINSVLNFATKKTLGLKIWSGSDIDDITGFQATISPYNNFHITYSYLTNNTDSSSIIKIDYGYKKYRNIAVKTMNIFNEKEINSIFGIEWQFYF